MAVKLKRAYETPAPDDGDRYLVERLWPRGIATPALALSAWLKELAPSNELRKWYGHDSALWPDFASRYQQELEAPEKREVLAGLAAKSRTRDITLVFATRDVEHSGALVLKELLDRLAARTP